MGKVLITCEKPDAAKNIAEILGCKGKHEGYFEDNNYIITWAYGHLIEWKKPEEINEAYKVWDLSYLPFDFDINKDLKVSSDKRKQYSIISKLIKRADVDYIVNAGDADREGLLIQEEIYRFAGNKKEVKVLWSQSLTEKEIIKCLNNLKERNDFVSLLESAKARSTIDMMMGFTYTRALAKTIANNNYISYGRCQTPLLKLLNDREEEIKNFKVEDYYEIKAKFDKGYDGVYVDSKAEIVKFKSEIEAKNVINDTVKTGKILDIKEEKKTQKAPNLFSLPELQKVMGSKYHFNADKTLDIAQKLYEMKLTSYPRTDTEYINDEVYVEIDNRIKSATTLLKIEINGLNKESLQRMVKPNKVTGHHALLPTEIVASKDKLEKLTNDELLVYKEICKRFIAIMMPDYEYLSTIVLTVLGDKNFMSKGIKVINDGYNILYKNDVINNDDKNEKEEDKALPNISVNDTVQASLFIEAKKTKPQPRYTTSTIITLMEKYGIGRPSTIAEIIKTLIKREFIELSKNKYIVTSKGTEFISIIPEDLKDPGITKNIEEKLTNIEEGKYTYKQLIDDVYNEQKDKIELLKKMVGTVLMKNPTIDKTSDYKCPICGSPLENQKFSYNCSCGFKISKEIAGKKLSESNISDICAKGKTSKISGFKKKAGGTFSAILEVDKANKKLEFKF